MDQLQTTFNRAQVELDELMGELPCEHMFHTLRLATMTYEMMKLIRADLESNPIAPPIPAPAHTPTPAPVPTPTPVPAPAANHATQDATIAALTEQLRMLTTMVMSN